MATIDRRLNLVIPIYDEVSSKVVKYVHASPISTETFKTYFDLIGKTYNVILTGGFGAVAGPRLASLLLHRSAADFQQLEAAAFMNEVRRLTNVIVPGKGTVPYQEAITQDPKLLSDEDIDEVENAVVFFMVSSAMLQRAHRKSMIERAAELWDAQITSFNCTEFETSLRTSTKDENTGEKKAPVLSVPR